MLIASNAQRNGPCIASIPPPSRSPRTPIPRRLFVHLRGHLLLAREVGLELLLAIGIPCGLVADIKASARIRVRIKEHDLIALNLLWHLIRRHGLQFESALGRIGRQNREARGREHVVLRARALLLRRTRGEQRAAT